jgi:Secretion system C-terminal sorting domain
VSTVRRAINPSIRTDRDIHRQGRIVNQRSIANGNAGALLCDPKPMSMKQFSTLVLGLAALGANAQPSLTFQNSSPQVGQSYTLNVGNYQDAPAGGSNQVWDFSDQPSTSAVLLEAVDPSNTANAVEFGFCNIALIATGNPYTRYYSNQSGGLFAEGFAHTSGFYMPYGARTEHPYPCTFQDTWSDPYGGSTWFQSVQYNINGTHVGEADGYGTLLMPWGTVADVLRIHVIDNNTQYTIGASSDYIEESYEYYAPDYTYPLVRTVDLKQVIPGGGIVQLEQQAGWLSEVTTGISEEPLTAALTLFPNPAHGSVFVQARGIQLASLELLDATGRVVLTEAWTMGSSTIDLKDLASGMYTVRASDVNGHRLSERLVVE